MNSDLETAKTLVLIALILNLVALAFALITIVLAFFPFLWLILDYFLVYKPLSEDDASSAETPALVLSILQLITLDILGGILLLVGWIKIRDGLQHR